MRKSKEVVVPKEAAQKMIVELVRAGRLIHDEGRPVVALSWYSWDSAEHEATVAAIDSNAWRFRLRRGEVESYGNGHFSVELRDAACGLPRVCSGSRGRGRKKAGEKRRGQRQRLRFWDWFTRQSGDLQQQPDSALMMSRMFRKHRGPRGERAIFARHSLGAKAVVPCKKCVLSIRKGRVCSKCRTIRLDPTDERPGFAPVHYGKIVALNDAGVDVRVLSMDCEFIVAFGLDGRSLVPFDSNGDDGTYYQADAGIIRRVHEALGTRERLRAKKVSGRKTKSTILRR